jgi:hypothetical protein
MRKTSGLFFVVAISLGLTTTLPAAVNSLSTAAGAVAGQTDFGIAIDAVSSGRACGKIGGVIVAQNPSCVFNGPIPPARVIGVVDGAGNTVNAESAKTAVVFGFKSYFTHADQTAVTLATFAQAEFTDPLTFTNPSGGAFDVTLDRLFTATDGLHGMELGGSGGPGSASASFHSDMSTNLTGLLFTLDVNFVEGQPLGISISLGPYMIGLPGWDQTTLQNALRTALGANSISSDYVTDSFNFPDIPIHVGAGQSLIVSTDDVSTAAGAPTPEGGTLTLFGTGLLGVLGAFRRRFRL